jgi:hypothetical protein
LHQTGPILGRLAIVVLIGAAVIWGALHFNLFASSVSATWSYDYTQTPPCSDAHPTDCIDHFELKDITHQQKMRLIQSANNPTAAAGKVDGIAAKFKYGPPFGEITFSVVAVERLKNGELVGSNPYAARAAANIRPGAKASLIF